MGSGSNGTNAGGNSNTGMTTGRHAIIFCHCFSTFIFFRLTLLLFRLFRFQQLQQQAGHERKEPDGRGGIYVGGDSNVGRHRGGIRGERVRFLYVFCPFYSPLLFL